jgi:hypothetical protein
MRQSSLWRLMFHGGRRTSSSETAGSDETTVVVPTASAATSQRPHLATGLHRHHNSRWTTPNGRQGSVRPAPPTESRARRTRRVASDIAAVVAMFAAVALLLAGIVLLASMIGPVR